MLRTFLLPVNAHDPPTGAIVEQLNAVYPTHERLGIAWIVTRFVSAPHVSNSAKLFGSPRDLRFIKSSFFKEWFCPCNESIYVQNIRRKIDVVSSGDARGRNESCAWIKQRPFPVPIAFFSRRS